MFEAFLYKNLAIRNSFAYLFYFILIKIFKYALLYFFVVWFAY